MHQVIDYAEKGPVLLGNVKTAPALVGEEDQELGVAAEVVSWLPGEAGHDEVLTWAW